MNRHNRTKFIFLYKGKIWPFDRGKKSLTGIISFLSKSVAKKNTKKENIHFISVTIIFWQKFRQTHLFSDIWQNSFSRNFVDDFQWPIYIFFFNFFYKWFLWYQSFTLNVKKSKSFCLVFQKSKLNIQYFDFLHFSGGKCIFKLDFWNNGWKFSDAIAFNR